MRRLPRIERGDEGARRFARQPVEARIALGPGFGYSLPPCQNQMARGFQRQEGRRESPGGETGGDSEGEGLEKFGKSRVLVFGRVFPGRRLFPVRQRPAAQTQSVDAQRRRNFDPAALDRPGPGRETQDDKPQSETEGRRRQFPRQGANSAGKRLGEAHQGPGRQCGEKARRQAETPRWKRQLTQTGRKTITNG